MFFVFSKTKISVAKSQSFQISELILKDVNRLKNIVNLNLI